MSHKIPILFVSHTSKLSGAERSLLSLVTKLNSLGKIQPIVLVPSNGPLVSELEKNKIQFIKINYHHWNGSSSLNRIFKGPIRVLINIMRALQFKQLIQEIQPQIIYCNTVANPFGAMLAMLYRIPCIWHIREFIHEDMGQDFDIGTKLATGLINKSETIICNSQAIKQKWSKYLNPEKLVVVYNGFDFPEVHENEYQKYQRCVQETAPITLVIIGSISPHKGQEDAIQALAILIKNGKNVRLKIAGSGRKNHLTKLKALAQKLNVKNQIEWLGFINSPSTVYHNAAITLVCSRHEAFGRVAVESMGYGTPVVVSNSAGLPEVINNGELGLLYNFGDYKNLAEQIEKLLADQKLYVTNSTKGRKSVIERFNVNHYALAIESALINALTN